jgi:hypothetical protein
MKERVLDQVALYLSDSCPRCSKNGFYGGGEFSLPPGGWSRLLSIAQVYGWNQRGHDCQRAIAEATRRSGKATHPSGIDVIGPDMAKK